MTRDQITLVVAAYRIPRKLMDMFLCWNEAVFAACDVKLTLVLDRAETFIQPWVTPLVYPVLQDQLSLPKTVNYGIRRATTDVVVKGDIDIVYSAEVLQAVLSTVTMATGFVGICANVQMPRFCRPRSWKQAEKRRTGMGACFALHRTSWSTLCGYNERIFGWGADDNDMYQRAKVMFHVVVSDEHPLWHVNHPERKSPVPGAFFEFRSAKNLSESRQPWYDIAWGEARP